MKYYPISEVLMNYHLEESVSEHGIEGTEDILYRTYTGTPHLRDKYLKFFIKKYKLKNK